MPVNVHPRVAVNAICSWHWSLQQDFALYRDLGVRTVGVAMLKLEPDRAAAIRAIQAEGLAVSSVAAGTPGAFMIAPPGSASPVALDMLRPGIGAAAALGAPCYFVSGATPPHMPSDEAYRLFVQALQPVKAHADGLGVRLAVEHNSTATRDNGFIHTLSDAVDLSRDTGIGICLELQNCWLERHLPRLFRDNAARFYVVQVSDYLVGEPLRLNRRVPGDGSIPLEWMLGLLLESGYQGAFELEYLGPKVEEEGYASAVRRGVEWLSERLTRWGV